MMWDEIFSGPAGAAGGLAVLAFLIACVVGAVVLIWRVAKASGGYS